MKKKLVVYFSRAEENYFGGSIRRIKVGNTEKVVNKIKEKLDVDIFRLEMQTPYSANYQECIQEAKKDLQNHARPELVKTMDNINEYDTIILAYPNYWGTCPMVVFTFLEQFDLSDKKIYPICTNEGSGMGGSENDLKKAFPMARIEKGLAIIGSEVDSADTLIDTWIKRNNF